MSALDVHAFPSTRVQTLSRLQSLSSSWRRMQRFRGSWMTASAQSSPRASWSLCVFLFLVHRWSKGFAWNSASACVHQGKGVPDVNSRLMVRKLWDTLHIPIFALVDADPHGRHHLSHPLLRASHISTCLPAPDTHISHRASRCSHLFGTSQFLSSLFFPPAGSYLLCQAPDCWSFFFFPLRGRAHMSSSTSF